MIRLNDFNVWIDSACIGSGGKIIIKQDICELILCERIYASLYDVFLELFMFAEYNLFESHRQKRQDLM